MNDLGECSTLEGESSSRREKMIDASQGSIILGGLRLPDAVQMPLLLRILNKKVEQAIFKTVINS